MSFYYRNNINFGGVTHRYLNLKYVFRFIGEKLFILHLSDYQCIINKYKCYVNVNKKHYLNADTTVYCYIVV